MLIINGNTPHVNPEEISRNKKSNYLSQRSHVLNDQSFQGFAVTTKLAEKLSENKSVQNALVSKPFNKFLKSAIENPGLYEALVSFLITCSLRPLSIMAIPGAKREDKEYAATQAVASGFTGLGFGYLFFNPIEKSINSILFDVNNKNVDKMVKGLYENHKPLVKELAEMKILPEKLPELSGNVKGETLFGKFNNMLAENGVSKTIEQIYTGSDVKKADKLRGAIKKLNEAITTEFDKVKFSGVENTKQYLVFKGLKFAEKGKIQVVLSDAAEKSKFIMNYGSKFVLGPIMAVVMIGLIPFIMSKLFPGRAKRKAAEKAMKQAEAQQQVQQQAQTQAQIKGDMLTDERNIIFAKGLRTSQVTFSEFLKNPSNPKGNQAQKPALASVESKKVADSVADVTVENKVNNTVQVNQTPSFKGGLSTVLSKTEKAYNKVYNEPVSKVLKKIFEGIAYNKKFSAKMTDLVSDATVTKYGITTAATTPDGTKIKKFDKNFFLNNFAAIVACWMSGFYILNTIRNKKIESERKPALCLNMGIVAAFSTFAGKVIENVFDPFKNSLSKKHAQLMKGKITYDAKGAWKQAYKLLVFTFAFRYLGPVLATPMADKMTTFLKKVGLIKDNQAKQPQTVAQEVKAEKK